ncbi:MAG: hypothetical protein VKK42_03990 [Lyngbya sp.]|nr:hypothetical protein [Lyngbya sp.]
MISTRLERLADSSIEKSAFEFIVAIASLSMMSLPGDRQGKPRTLRVRQFLQVGEPVQRTGLTMCCGH